MFSTRVFSRVSGHLPTQSESGVAQILLLCSVVFVLHAVIPVERSLPLETNAVVFWFWQLISVCSYSFGAGRIFLSR